MEEIFLWLLLLGYRPRFLQRWLGLFGLDLRSDDSALDTLRRRYAAGKITREQFEEMKEVLAKQSSVNDERRQNRTE